MTAANFVIISVSEFFIFSSIVSELTIGFSSVPSDDSIMSTKSSISPAAFSFVVFSLLICFPFVSLPLFVALRYRSTTIIPTKIAAMTIKRKLSAMPKPPTPTIWFGINTSKYSFKVLLEIHNQLQHRFP